jgi:hypothetical protein
MHLFSVLWVTLLYPALKLYSSVVFGFGRWSFIDSLIIVASSKIIIG